jgi:hypothetical protein
MTDELTDAVRRLKELQTDVERLKASRDQEGVPRLLFQVTEAAEVSETTRIGPDVAQADAATVADQQTKLVDRDVLSSEAATVADQQTKLVDRDVFSSEAATAADQQTDLRLQRRFESTAAYNSVGYRTSGYGDVEFVRLSGGDVGGGADNLTVNGGDIAPDEIGRAPDALTLNGGTLSNGAYSSTGYLTATYQ